MKLKKGVETPKWRGAQFELDYSCGLQICVYSDVCVVCEYVNVEVSIEKERKKMEKGRIKKGL